MIKSILQQGFVLKTKGFYKHAIEAFYKALELDNSSVELLLEIANCYYLMNNEEHALSYIEQILDKEPTHIETLKLLKQIFIDKKAFVEAIKTAENVYSISRNSDSLAELLYLLNQQGRYQEVLNYNSEQTSSKVIFELAYASLFMNQLQEAESLINQVVSQESSAKAIVLKGKILFKMNKMDECVELMNSISFDEEDADSLNFAGLIKQYECRFKDALELFLKAIKLTPEKDEYYYNCASTYFKIGEIQQAKKYYNLAISLNPENQNYHFALANLYYSQKNYRRAMEELRYDFFEAKLLKSIILYESGYLALAKKEFDMLILEQPSNELIADYRMRIEKELCL